MQALLEQPIVVPGHTPEAYLQTLANCGMHVIYSERRSPPYYFARAWQWPDVLRYFAKGLWKKIWLPAEETTPGLNQIPDALVTRGDRSIELCLAVAVEGGVRSLTRYENNIGKLLGSGEKVVIIGTDLSIHPKDTFDLSLPEGAEVVGFACVVDRRVDPCPLKLRVRFNESTGSSYSVPVYSLLTKKQLVDFNPENGLVHEW